MLGFYVRDGQAIAAGQKRAVVTPSPREDLSGPRILVVRDGDRTQAVGILIFEAPLSLDAAGFKAAEGEHCISAADRLRWWPEQDPLYLHRVQAYYPFTAPQPVDFEPGSNMNVAAGLEARIVEQRGSGPQFTYVLGVDVQGE